MYILKLYFLKLNIVSFLPKHDIFYYTLKSNFDEYTQIDNSYNNYNIFKFVRNDFYFIFGNEAYILI